MVFRSRRWTAGPGSANRVEVEIGSALAPTELTDLDHFLTARWRLFTVAHSHLRYAQVSHEPWPLRRVDVRQLEDELLAITGLPSAQGAPLAHFSDGVTARVSAPHRVTGT